MACRVIRAGPGRPRPAPPTPSFIGHGRGPVATTAFTAAPITSGVSFLEGFCFSGDFEILKRYGFTFAGSVNEQNVKRL